MLIRLHGEGLEVVVAEVGYLDGGGAYGSHFVSVIDDFAGFGHEDVVSVNEEGLERLVAGLGEAEVFEIDGRRFGRTGWRRRRGCNW